ncbi:glycosyltransferase [Crocinitomix catalasitica]|uniref:glycosyltransferase n=1 Tax=Crocinitomix catalasitica TaxID=184607 RepID=UPI00048963B5|nr:glycosyltransferase [Crocinitomix catalasitica]
MKIFVLLSRFPYPLEKGDKLRAYYQIKELAKDHEIHLFCLSDKKVSPEDRKVIEEIVTSLQVAKLNKIGILWNLFLMIFSAKPFQIGYFYQKWIHQKIKNSIQKINPDHIYCQLIRTSEYVKDIHNTPKTIDYMDALGKGMYRRASISKGLKKWLLLQEGKRLSAYENRIFDYFNHHTIISDQDSAFINHPQHKSITIVENGVAPKFSSFDQQVDKVYELVFTGNMNYAPNIECAEYIALQILPLLSKENLKVKLLLSGANPHHRIKQLNHIENVTVTGWVDDIRLSYAQGKIFIAPLFIGTGLQNKLLEAMLMGLPCITTTMANNALKAIPNESILIANSAEEFSTSIRQLLNDENFYNEIAQNGKQMVSNMYSWEKSVEKLNQLFKISNPN